MPVPSVEILAGPETGRRNEHIAQLRAVCAREWGAEPEEHRRYAFETDVQDLLSLLRNGSLFSSGKIVTLFGAELIKGKADTGALAAYIRNPADSTVLLLVTEGYGLEKALEDAVGKDRKRTFWELGEGEKRRWVKDFFLKEGLEAEDEAVDAVLELVENNTEALKAECARLILFFPQGERIRAGDVEAYVAHNREEDAFSLFDRMATGTLERALETLDAILVSREGTGIGLLGGLLWSFRRLRSLHESMDAGIPYDQAARALRITSRKLQATYHSALERWSKNACSSILAFGVETDAQLRALGSVYERLLLELFVYGCVVRKGSVPLTVLSDW